MARCKWIDAVVWIDGDNAFEGVKDECEWRERIAPLFERFAYGREKAPTTGRRHFQFRGVLKKTSPLMYWLPWVLLAFGLLVLLM